MRHTRLGAALLAAPALAVSVSAPASAEPRVYESAFTITSPGAIVPGTEQASGPVLHYDLVDASVTSGGGLELRNTSRYSCVQVGARAVCQGTALSDGSIDGVGSGAIRSHITVHCDFTTFTCEGTTQTKGVSGDLAGVRGTGTFTTSFAAGGGTFVFRLTSS